MSVGENLKRLREEKGITRTELAKELGITNWMLNMMERGSRNISVGYLDDITRVLGCSIEDILCNNKEN